MTPSGGSDTAAVKPRGLAPKRYEVTVSVLRYFTVVVLAANAKEAEQKAREGEHEESYDAGASGPMRASDARRAR